MTLREILLYIKGKRNPDGYRFNPFDYFKHRNLAKFICVLMVISLIFDAICLLGFTTWPELLYTLNIVDTVEKQDSNFVIHYLDTGRGECSIIICDDHVMMIDSGTSFQYFNIWKHLYLLEIDKIDYLLLTHPHDDHIGSASKIINNYPISNLFLPKLSNENNVSDFAYDDLIKTMSESDVNYKTVSAGDSFMLGSALVEILAPMKQDNNINNMSVVTKITYGNTSFLFTGDIEKEVEKQLLRKKIDVSADVLKVGHHGSKTSTTDEFLSAVNPKYAVISGGAGNNYGHPSATTLEKFVNRGMIPYITTVNGDITVTSDGNEIEISTEKRGYT